MFEQLKNYKGNKIIVELANGRQIAGIVAAVNQQDIRLETDEGNCVVLVSAIQVVWENMTRTLQLRAAGEDSASLGTHLPCFMAYTAPCTQAFGGPCGQPFCQPCTTSYTEPCPQPPCPDPCFERFGYSEHHCLERFYGQHHPGPAPSVSVSALSVSALSTSVSSSPLSTLSLSTFSVPASSLSLYRRPGSWRIITASANLNRR